MDPYFTILLISGDEIENLIAWQQSWESGFFEGHGRLYPGVRNCVGKLEYGERLVEEFNERAGQKVFEIITFR